MSNKTITLTVLFTMIAGLALTLLMLLTNTPTQINAASTEVLYTIEDSNSIEDPKAPAMGTVEVPTKKNTQTVASQNVLPVNNTISMEESQVEYEPAQVSTPVEAEQEAQPDYINSGSDDNNILSENHKRYIEGEMSGDCPTDNLECGMPDYNTPGSDHNQDTNQYSL